MEKHFDGSLESQVNTRVFEEKERWSTSGVRNVHIHGARLLERAHAVYNVNIREFQKKGNSTSESAF